MKPLPFSPDVKAALDEFDSWGAVVDHVLFAAPGVVDGAAHEMAAKLGIATVLEAGRKRAPRWKLTLDLPKIEVAQAERRTPQEFFGSHFSVATQKPLFKFEHSVFLHPFDDEENAHSRLEPVVSSDELDSFNDAPTQGYAYAILEPPYGLARRIPWRLTNHSLVPSELGPKFLQLCDVLFGDIKTLEIYDWPTDCSNYFDPGLEWWGSSFWTVYAPSKNWIIVILASSTD